MNRKFYIYKCTCKLNGREFLNKFGTPIPTLEGTEHMETMLGKAAHDEALDWLEENEPHGNYGKYIIGVINDDVVGGKGEFYCGMEFAICYGMHSLYYGLHDLETNTYTRHSNAGNVISSVGSLSDWEYKYFVVDCLLWRTKKVAEYEYRDFEAIAT